MKALTVDNWLDPDPLALAFSNIYDGAIEQMREMSRDEFIGYSLKPTLSQRVPEEIRLLFEGARGAMVYGYFYYPLFMLGAERLFITGEAAIRYRAKQIRSVWRRNTSFETYVNFLADQGVISEERKEGWHLIRSERNAAIHTDRRQLAPPGMAIDLLIRAAEAIDDLFRER